jgi:glucosamine-6-phosphate deaminase
MHFNPGRPSKICAIRNGVMPVPQVHVHPHLVSASVALAADLRARVQANPELVLGLPTGSTPKALYAEMVRLHDADGMDWSRTRSFNLDEYWPMAANHPQSFARFMREQLFELAHFDLSRTYIPSGEVAPESIALHCAAYEAAIQSCGGIEIQILGVGLNGHLGFNEPGAARDSRTDLVELAASTRERAAAAFASDSVPKRGITMGLATILEAKEIVVLAFGAEKADAIAAVIEGPVSEDCPASFLQEHPAVRWYLDEAAASGLSKRAG